MNWILLQLYFNLNNLYIKLVKKFILLVTTILILLAHIEIIAIRAFDIPETGAWTNDFAFMGQDPDDNSWWIYYAEG